MASDDIRPFRVEVPDAVLDDLRERLARTRWPDQIPGSGWGYGTDLAYLQDLCDVLAQRLRLARKKSGSTAGRTSSPTSTASRSTSSTRAPTIPTLPLIITHGWPGSVAEFLDVIEPLREDFHVVVAVVARLRMVGSDDRTGLGRAARRGGVEDVDGALGYDRYGAQGGDWGAMISARSPRSTPSTWSACTPTCSSRSPTTRAGSSSPSRRSPISRRPASS